MDESEVLKFEQAAKTLKLSEAIRAFGYVSYAPEECVLGLAITGVTGCQYLDWPRKRDESYIDIACRLFNTTPQLCRKAENMCLHNESKEHIADYVESQGY